MVRGRRMDPLLAYLEDPTPDRLRDLFRVSHSLLVNVAYRILGDAELAEDIAQDIYRELMESRPKREEVRGIGFLASKARSLAIARRVGNSRRGLREAEAARSVVGPGGPPADVLIEARNAVLSLPDSLRAFVILRYFDGLNIRSVAASMGVSPETVHARLVKAHTFLRQRISAPAALLLSPILLGEATAALPRVAVSMELGRRLEGMVSLERARVRARESTRHARVVLVSLAVPAALLLVMVSIPLVGRLFAERGGGDGEEVQVAVEEGVPHDALLMAAAPPLAVELTGADPVLEDAGAPRAAEPETPPPAEEPKIGAMDDAPAVAPTSLELRVVDPAGNLLELGTVEFRVKGLEPDPLALSFVEEVEKDLVARALFGDCDLSDANPIVIENVPDEAIQSGVIVRVRGKSVQPGGEPTTVALEKGKRTVAEVVVSMVPELKVVVRDARTGDAIEGARVEAVASSLDLQGHFVVESVNLPGMEAGERTSAEGTCTVRCREGSRLHVEKEGYFTAKVEPKLEPRSGQNEEGADGPEDFTVWLHPRQKIAAPTCGVTVLVLDPAGKPWPGVEIEYLRGIEAATRQKTDASGACRFQVGEGRRYFHVVGYPDDAEKRGFMKAIFRMKESAIVEAKAGEETHLVLGLVEGSATIAIEVHQHRGKPAQHVRASIHGVTVSKEGETDKKGWASFKGLLPDTYRISVGTWTIEEPVKLSAGGQEARRIHLGRAVIRGRVVRDGDGKSALTNLFIRGARSAVVLVDGDGEFEVEEAVAGKYVLEALDVAGRRSAAVEVVVPPFGDPAEVELLLVEASRVNVVVRGAEGKGIEGATVKLVEEGRTRSLPRSHTGKREVVFSLESAQPGEHTFLVEAPGHAAVTRSVEVRAGEDATVEVDLGGGVEPAAAEESAAER